MELLSLELQAELLLQLEARKTRNLNHASRLAVKRDFRRRMQPMRQVRIDALIEEVEGISFKEQRNERETYALGAGCC